MGTASSPAGDRNVGNDLSSEALLLLEIIDPEGASFSTA